jgi:hypothetical protein
MIFGWSQVRDARAEYLGPPGEMISRGVPQISSGSGEKDPAVIHLSVPSVPPVKFFRSSNRISNRFTGATKKPRGARSSQPGPALRQKLI